MFRKVYNVYVLSRLPGFSSLSQPDQIAVLKVCDIIFKRFLNSTAVSIGHFP